MSEFLQNFYIIFQSQIKRVGLSLHFRAKKKKNGLR